LISNDFSASNSPEFDTVISKIPSLTSAKVLTSFFLETSLLKIASAIIINATTIKLEFPFVDAKIIKKLSGAEDQIALNSLYMQH